MAAMDPPLQARPMEYVTLMALKLHNTHIFPKLLYADRTRHPLIKEKTAEGYPLENANISSNLLGTWIRTCVHYTTQTPTANEYVHSKKAEEE